MYDEPNDIIKDSLLINSDETNKSNFSYYYDKYIEIKKLYETLDNYIESKEKEIRDYLLNIDVFIKNYKEIIPEYKDIIPKIIKETPVNLIIKKIYDQIKLQHIKCDHEIIILLSKLINCSEQLLKYNPYLYLII